MLFFETNGGIYINQTAGGTFLDDASIERWWDGTDEPAIWSTGDRLGDYQGSVVGFLRRDKSGGGGQQNVAALFGGSAADLTRIGTIAFGGDSPHPPGSSSVPVSDLDSYAVAFLDAAGYPSSGTPEYSAARDRFLEELNAVASTGSGLTYVGAFMVARNALVEMEAHPGYLSLVDRGVEALRLDGVAFPSVPPFALERYEQVHGNSGLGPANWPSALTNVDVPTPGAEPATRPLADDEARRVAEIQVQGASRQVFAERRDGGRVVAVLEGAVEDGRVKRWDWPGVEAADYPSFLRELGERLVTPSLWFHEDLAPYFPCRPKTREDMRTEARQAGQPTRLTGQPLPGPRRALSPPS